MKNIKELGWEKLCAMILGLLEMILGTCLLVFIPVGTIIGIVLIMAGRETWKWATGKDLLASGLNN